MGNLDRLSVGHVVRDHWRSLRKHGSGARDGAARYALVVLPSMVTLAALGFTLRLSDPTALLPAVALLSGVLLAASGQLISLRARVADSVTMAGNPRVRAVFREAVSGVLLAALAAFATAVMLATAALLPPTKGLSPFWASVVGGLDVGLSCLTVGALTFLTLMFLSTVRRLYGTYLEAFEDGLPLRKHEGQGERIASGGSTGDSVSIERDDDSEMVELGIAPTSERRQA